MIKGISITVENRMRLALFEILNCVNIKDYKWHIKYSDVIDLKYNQFFKTVNFDGLQFYDKIVNNESYVIHIDLRGYLNENYDRNDFSNYEGFIESKCNICLIIIDCSYAELFIKDERILKKMFLHLENKKMEPKYITNETIRVCFDVYQ